MVESFATCHYKPTKEFFITVQRNITRTSLPYLNITPQGSCHIPQVARTKQIGKSAQKITRLSRMQGKHIHLACLPTNMAPVASEAPEWKSQTDLVPSVTLRLSR